MMFKDFGSVWTPICEARLVNRRKPLKCRVAGEDLVLFRNHDDRIVAMPEACPHRGASLAIGTITERGAIRCPYHGLEFGAAGTARLRVIGDEPCRAVATIFETRELGGLVWLFTSATTAPDREPVVPSWMTDESWHCSIVTMTWRTHWSVAMENQVDPLHTAYVHASSIGMRDRNTIEKFGRLVVHVRDTETGCQVVSEAPGTLPTWEFWSEWIRPNCMVLTETGFRTATWCVPVDEHLTTMIFAAATDHASWGNLRNILRDVRKLIFPEDRRVLETIYGEVLPPEKTALLPTDTAVARFRAYYYETLKARSQ